MTGELSAGMSIYNANKRETKKPVLYILRGKKQIQVDKLTAGDIGAIAKLQNTVTGDTLCDPASPVMYEGIEFPEPSISMAVAVEKKGKKKRYLAD